MILRLSIRSLVIGVALLSACATTRRNHLRVAIAQQDQCCRALTDPSARNACLAEMPRSQDETSPINQETFRCVATHFQCNAVTGRATQPSAQQQLDCLNDLPSTQTR